jgi:opacity protein-like surface antigen
MMQGRILSVVAVMWMAGLVMVSPAQAAGFELTPFIGYTGGGDFTNVATGKSLSLDETSSYGILLGFKQAPDPKQPGTAWLELYLSRQQTQLRFGSAASVVKPTLDLDIEYYHIGGTYGQAEGKVQPFVAGTFGATRMVPQQYGLSSETKFSLSLGGGVKLYLTEHVGIRLEGRWLGTLVSANGGMFCSNGACLVTVQGDMFSQYVANAGIILAF